MTTEPNRTSNKSNPKKKKGNPINNIRCFYTNATSIQSNVKMNQFRAHIVALDYPDIVFVCETWFTNETINYMDGYQLFFKNRESGDAHGGVAIYIKTVFEAYDIEDIKLKNLKSEQIWCKIKLNSKNDTLLVGCVYRPPKASRETNQEINLSITTASNLVANKKYKYLLIAGDWNYSDIEWSDLGGECRENGRASSLEFLENINSNFLTQLVHEPTFQKNTLDLVFTDNPNRIFVMNVNPPFGTSKEDHLHATLVWDYLLDYETNTNTSTKILYEKSNFFAIEDKLRATNWREIFDGIDANQMYEIFIKKYEETVEELVPKYKQSNEFNCKKNQPKWFSASIKTLTKEKHKLWVKIRASKNVPVELKNKYKIVCKKITKKVLSSRIEYEKSITIKAKNNPKLLYSYLKEQNKCKDNIRSLISVNGVEIVNKTEIATCLNQTFVKVFSDCNNSSEYPELPCFPQQNEIIETEIFSEYSVLKELKQLVEYKSIGVDGVHPIILKRCAPICAEIFSLIYIKSYTTGIVPCKWKEANIIPLPKSGAKTNPSNYRPISLTSIPCKIFERIIKREMMKHLNKHNLISNQQHGFVQHKSCVTNLIESLDFLTETLNRGFSAILIYLDFAKAFDKVSHRALGYKLKCYGFTTKLIEWLNNFLSNRRQRVKIDEYYSEWENVLSGVAQGSVIGPLLFIIFINDMPNIVSNYIKLFADDSKILAQIKNKDLDYKLIQNDLNSLVKWSKDWQMTFNSDKCKVMRIGKGKLLIRNEIVENKKVKNKIIYDSAPLEFYMMDSVTDEKVILSETKLERDLGIQVANNLKSFEQAKKAAARANSVLGQLKRSIIKWDNETLKTLYKTAVRPHLEYASSAWAPYRNKDIKMLEVVQKRATKLVPELRNLPYEKRLQKLGLTTLEARRERGDAIQYFKIINNFNKVEWYHPNSEKPASKLDGPAKHLRNNKINSKQLYRQITRSCDQREYFFSNRIVPLWNELPDKVTNAININNFKKEYDNFKKL